ncbi:MAG: murein biosynthesis integral membrane protein MurJ [Chloroflexi bacterium]|nr:murein biosynthesis integral membrane protein MurJ [Chloroflexota bacterium]
MGNPQVPVTANPAHAMTARSLIGAAGVIAIGNVSSRALGLARETVIYDTFGASGLVSSYRAAARLPTIIFDLLIGGMVTSALVPVFSEYAGKERSQDLERLASSVMFLAMIFLVLVILVLEMAAPWLTLVLVGGLPAELRTETLVLIRIILPAVLFLGLSGVTTSILYARKQFIFPAFVAAVFNASIIVAALFLGHIWGIRSLVIGLVIGAALQVLLQLPGLRGLKLRPRLNLNHPGLRRILILYTPVIIGLVVSQIAVIIDTNLASRAGESVLAWMGAATTLIQFPLGLIVTAISTAVLPSLARTALLDEFRQTLGLGLRLVLLLIIPATVGMWLLGQPLVRLLFEHGQFTPADTAATTLALSFYLIGLPCAAIDQPLVYAFYARKNTSTPVIVGILAIGVYLIVALTLIQPLGMVGLVLANSAQWCSHMVIMLILTHLRLGGLDGLRLGKTVRGSLGSTAIMAISILGTLALHHYFIHTTAGMARLTELIVPAATGMLLYLAGLLLFRVEEVRFLSRLPAILTKGRVKGIISKL